MKGVKFFNLQVIFIVIKDKITKILLLDKLQIKAPKMVQYCYKSRFHIFLCKNSSYFVRLRHKNLIENNPPQKTPP